MVARRGQLISVPYLTARPARAIVRHMETPTGLDLKIERIRAGVMVKDLASEMGITASRLSRIEGDSVRPVTTRMLTRYRTALGTCRTQKAA